MTARTLPAKVSPLDFYGVNLDRPLGYFEGQTSEDNICMLWGKMTITDGKNESGVCGYFETHIAGTTSGHTYGFGSWINVDAGAVLSAGHIIVPFEGGVYTEEAQATARIVFAGQHQAILTGAPASLHAWRLNTTQTITALIAAANSGSVGYVANTGTSGTKVGYVPLFDIAGGPGVRYIRLYDAGT